VKVKPTVNKKLYQTQDRKYGCQLSNVAIQRMLRLCQQSRNTETGGVLVGYYTQDYSYAVVTEVSSAPIDSRSGPTWFQRGIVGIQVWLNSLWKQRQPQYYLGEWHFHPGSTPQPSSTDIAQMKNIAASKQYQCPEPLLIIIGGTPPNNWSIRVFVFSDKTCYELAEINKDH
jgi:integrative and conjugative element protein (TIGR02256 family)